MLSAFTLSFVLVLLLDGIPSQLIDMKRLYGSVWVGADVVVKQPQASDLPQQILDEGTAVSRSIKMSTMMLLQDDTYLIHLQLIDDQYPLLGRLAVYPNGLIPPGSVWMAEEFAQQIGLSLGDQVFIGDKSWTIAGFVTHQDEQVLDFKAFSPSVFMRYDQAADVGLISDISRLNHYTYFSSQDSSVLAQQLREQLPKDARVIEPSESLGRIERLLSQVVNVLWISRLLGYVMAGFLMHLALEHYHHHRARDIGILMALGVGRSRRIGYLCWPIVYTLFLGMIVGAGVCVPLIKGFAVLLNQNFPVEVVLPLWSLIQRACWVFTAIGDTLMLLHLSSMLTVQRYCY